MVFGYTPSLAQGPFVLIMKLNFLSSLGNISIFPLHNGYS